MWIERPRADGIALFLVLAVQLVLSLMATMAIREAWLQQMMVGQAWQSASHRVLMHRAMEDLERDWLAGGLFVHDQALLKIDSNDCALSAWLKRSDVNPPWRLWRQIANGQFSYIVIRWAPGVCQTQDAAHPAHTILMKAQHHHHSTQYIQSIWMGTPAKHHHWRWVEAG